MKTTSYVSCDKQLVKSRPTISTLSTLFLVFLVFAAYSQPGLATTIDVTTTSACTLSDAIAAINGATNVAPCNAGEKTAINLAAGTYTVTSTLTINKSMTIIGNSSADTIIKRTGTGGVLSITGGLTTVVTIENVKITGGNITTVNNGGGILNSGKLTLKNVEITGNKAGGTGGAIAVNAGGELNLDNVKIYGNESGRSGGAIYGYGGDSGTKITISNNSIIGGDNAADANTSGQCGGGIRIATSDASISIADSQIKGNKYKSVSSDLVAGTAQLTDGGTNTIAAWYSSCWISTIVVIDSYARTNDASQLEIDDLSDFMNGVGVTGAVEANLDGYKKKIEEADCLIKDGTAINSNCVNPDTANDTQYGHGKTNLQNIVTSVNTGVTDLAAVAANDNADGKTATDIKAMLLAAGIKDVVDANADAYLTAIVAKGGTDADTVPKLQAIVDNTNLAEIQAFAGGTGDLVIGQLQVSKLTNVRPDLLEKYKAAIKAAGSAGITSWADLQAIIDAVNSANPSGTGGSTDGGNTGGSNTGGSGAGTGTVFYMPPPLPDYFQISIGSPNGRVYTSPAGIDCNKGQGVCSATFKRGQLITLNVQAPEGVIFAGWSGSNVCSRGSFNIYNSLNCNALFYGDPNYVKPEQKQPETNPSNNVDSSGSISSEHPKTYIHSFSVRANIAAKSTCSLTQTHINPNEVAVAGFILRGTGSERVLINARGLEAGVEPKLLLKQTIVHPNGKLEAKDISENANWESHANAVNIPVAYRPKQAIDAALLVDLPAGIYTVTACMNAQAMVDSGVALMSVTPLDNKLSFSNASGRGYVGGGADDVIVGFSVFGTDKRQVQLRGRALGNMEENTIDTTLKVGRIYLDPVSNSIKGEEISKIASQRAEQVRQARATGLDSNVITVMDFLPGSYTTILGSESGKRGLGILSVDFMD